ncbi:uncharacterized protein Dwil_GK10734 [Drosophila willistoni]|uniref:RanBP2-type domain-containing protein n=1 Tax=Drosophila willistoni TaxID=7260 RepID=B4MIV3_DROWI|nr:putative mediator of RNA polymerase II transcription subunit 12 isoform X1 [Drosophila willistoni]EDW72042.1 uncharacterized protein Dwil_GK10734 [Drosophila willistoni]
MAATPPMPPGATANSNQLNGDLNGAASHDNQDTNKPQTVAEALNQHFIQRRKLSKCSLSRSCSNEQLLQETESQQVLPAKTKPNCQCTNISIMHLFHEMKQEFPTIPDTIVTQCVNENCHQRENCIQMLRKELALHPIPVQSYPAKVLQQQQQRQATKPPTPLKPIRVAPTQPPTPQPTTTTTTTPTPTTTTPPSSNGQQPRARPTTLNLQRQLNTQLQQKIHQRQQQQQPQQRRDLTPTSLNKPLRRAPPLPPQQQQQPPPLAPKPSSFSNDSSCLTSPMSSSESEISLNALSSPTAPAAAASSPSAAAAATPLQASPVRHRSVITLQPEPPYARDFLTPPSPTSVNPTTTAGRKSFTSLNLTLRQPTTTGVAQSAIDITAGPAPSGQGSGITYSSSSFDAVRGTHKNFQLTVTDEGSVFSAGCIGPRQQQQATQVYPSSLDADGSTAAAAAIAMPEVFPYPTQAANHIVASNYNNNNNNDHGSSSTDSSPSVALYNGIVLDEADREAHAATIVRQKHRRDKLANALRDNKKRLLVLEQEINILTEPVPVGESERLDRDIKKLTEDCQRLINVLNDPQMNATGPEPNSMHRQQSAPAGSISQHQQQPQPFPRQRPSVNRLQNPPNSLRFNSVPAPTVPTLDFVQQHSSAPTSACLTPQQPQLPQHPQLPMEPPPTYAQYYQFQQFLQHQRQQQIQQQQQQQLQLQQLQQQQQQQLQSPQQQQQASNYDDDFSESDVDEDEEPLDMWACNLCTFRNHPQLNMCEACENVRIQPGMIRIVPSNGGAPPPPSQGDQPQSQQQQPQPPQQPYALHT